MTHLRVTGRNPTFELRPPKAEQTLKYRASKQGNSPPARVFELVVSNAPFDGSL